MHNPFFLGALVLYILFFLVLVVSLCVWQGNASHARLSLWSNLFYLWPTVRALLLRSGLPAAYTYPAAWGEATVFFVTFTVSTFHHGCHDNMAIRMKLAAETYWVLWIGVMAALIAVAYTTWRWQRRAKWLASSIAWILVPLMALIVASIVVLALLLHNVSDKELDGCAWPHAAGDATYNAVDVVELVAIWSNVDYVTAFSALIIAILFIMQLTGTMMLALLWLFAVLLLVLRLFSEYLTNGPTQANIFATLLAGGALFAACQCAVCCSYPADARRVLVARYDWVDFAATMLVGTAAILVFVIDNTPAMHSIWHATGALALYFAVESLYRKHSLFIGSFSDSQKQQQQV